MVQRIQAADRVSATQGTPQFLGEAGGGFGNGLLKLVPSQVTLDGVEDRVKGGDGVRVGGQHGRVDACWGTQGGEDSV